MLNPHSARRLACTVSFYALTVIATVSLMLPLTLIKASERGRPTTKAAPQERPNNAPPQPFSIGDPPIRSKASEIVSSVRQQIREILFPPDLPEEFRTAKLPTLSERLSAKLAMPATTVSRKEVVGTETGSVETPAPPQPAAAVDFDFDGDGKADVSRWDPVTTEFQIRNSNGASISTYTFSSASSGAKPAPADYDGDGMTDAAVFDSGTWFIRKSSDGSTASISFGQAGDIPASGNYRTSASADELAVYRPSNGTWYWREFAGSTVYSNAWGVSTDIPAAGDYDGDGLLDWAVYRPSSGVWWVAFNAGGTTGISWGVSTDIPVAADYDADGKTDAAVFRPSTGVWWILKSSDSSFYAETWGNWADQPAPSDYNGDNKADPAVWRPSSGVWFVDHTGASTFEYHNLGHSGDVAANSAYIKQVGGTVSSDALSLARLAPRNATGGTDLYSQNFAWGTALVSLPGRSGLDLNIGLSYNSLVWTREGNAVYFDTDYSNVSPGFNLGFATIEPAFYADGKWNFLMITPSGARVRFRQVGAGSTYETIDSSYLQLKMDPEDAPDDPPKEIKFEVFATNGTAMSYSWAGGAFRCVAIKDRNGNFLSMNYNEWGFLETVTDTLGRVVTVNYDAQFYPTSITQTWKSDNGSGSSSTHTWATFIYAATEIQTDFDGVTVAGPPNGTYIKALEKIVYPDTSWTKFLYNGYGQVKKIENYADDDHLLNYTRTDLDSVAADQTDCPRFTLTASRIENFNLSGGAGTEQEVVVTNSAPASDSETLPGSISVSGKYVDVGLTGHPDGLYSRTWFGGSGVYEGLVLATQDCTGSDCGEVKRWTWRDWAQDDPYSSIAVNPRVKETRVGDGTNTRRTKVKYLDVTAMNPVATFGLVSEVEVFSADLTTVIKRSTVSYDLSSNYTGRRIIGLPSETNAWGWNDLTSSLEHVSKVTYAYDEGDFSDSGLQQNISPVQHDSTNYGSGFNYRGNLTSTTRWDVTQPTNGSAAITSSLKYNTAGSVVARITPWDGTNTRTVKIGYADNWNSISNPTTYAYPTVMTAPNGSSLGDSAYSSTAKYRYDIGTNVEAISPAPTGQTYGKKSKRVFDSVGRLERDSVYVNTTEKSYVRYEYPSNGVQSKTYAPIVDQDNDGNIAEDEVYTESWFDGAGRVRKSRTEHSGSAEGWASTFVEYDILGRVKRQSAPLETDDAFDWTGGDDSAGPLWTHFDYDWMGRVTRKVNTDGDPNEDNDSDVLYSYAGCGCAGGLETTMLSERVPIPGTQNTTRRKQKSYSDILGRPTKLELYDWADQVYKVATYLYNGRDQILRERVFAGTESATEYRDTVATFDGHGRLASKKEPQQDNNTATVYTYFKDDMPETIADARGATKHYQYNTIGLIDEVGWTVPQNSGISIPTTVEFDYDNLGNRVGMTDGSGEVVYEINELSQTAAETREFNETISQSPTSDNKFRLEYSYDVSGQLRSYKEPFGEIIAYGFDKSGRTRSVTGDRTIQSVQISYVTDALYRAWDSTKSINFLGSLNLALSFDNRQQISQFEFGGARLEYEYYGDGRLKSSDTDYNFGVGWEDWSQFDRSYEYDYLGRLTAAKTGAESHGQIETDGNNRPFRLINAFNQFNEVTASERKHWLLEKNDSFTYQNGRMTTEYRSKDLPGWFFSNDLTNHTFDADGRPTDNGEEYDADGRQNAFDEISPTYAYSAWNEIFYDGDGKKIVMMEKVKTCYAPNNPPCVTRANKTYRVNSTVLGRNVVDLKYDGLALGRDTMIIANGVEIAKRFKRNIGTQYEAESWSLITTDPSGTELLSYAVDGSNLWGPGLDIMDPLGAGVGTENPYPQPEEAPDPENPDDCDFDFDHDGGDECTFPGEYEDPATEGVTGSVGQSSCYIDGFEQRNCEQVAHQMAVHDDSPVVRDQMMPDSAPSDPGPQGIHQNDDPTDNNGNAGEKAFEQQYTASGNVSFGQAAGVSVDVSASNIIGTAGDWDLRTETVPRPEPTPPMKSAQEASAIGISDDCKNALAAINKNETILKRAHQNRNWFVFPGQHFDPQVLAAIAIRESEVDPNAIQGGGLLGRGLMQIDIGQHPQYANDPNLFNPNWSVQTADAIMANEFSNLQRFGYGGYSLTLMALRVHNAGYFKSGRAVDKARMRRFSTSTNPADFDPGTTGSNYVSSIVNIAKDCFPEQWVY